MHYCRMVLGETPTQVDVEPRRLPQAIDRLARLDLPAVELDPLLLIRTVRLVVLGQIERIEHNVVIVARA